MRPWLLALMCCWQACFWARAPLPSPGIADQLEPALPSLLPAGRPLSLVGVRDEQGRRTELTRLFDEEIAGALVRLGAQFAVAPGDEDWNPPELVPARYGEEGPGLLLTGQVRRDSTALYLRLQALEGPRQRLLAGQTLRFAAPALEARVAAAPAAGAGLAVDLQLLALHEEGGFAQQVALADGGRLQVGDRLKLRFRTGSDCQVYAWLYSSGGQAQDLFASQQVYQGRLQETSWLTLDQANQVWTLYLAAAPHLGEDHSELFASLSELMRQGQVQQFTGLERVDAVVGQYLARHNPGHETVPVVRQAPALGQEEKIILDDGTVLKARALRLQGTGILVQALSFEVQ